MLKLSRKKTNERVIGKLKEGSTPYLPYIPDKVNIYLEPRSNKIQNVMPMDLSDLECTVFASGSELIELSDSYTSVTYQRISDRTFMGPTNKPTRHLQYQKKDEKTLHFLDSKL